VTRSESTEDAEMRRFAAAALQDVDRRINDDPHHPAAASPCGFGLFKRNRVRLNLVISDLTGARVAHRWRTGRSAWGGSYDSQTMQVVDEALIAEAGRRIAAAAPDAQVILFGSHARGGANPHSDVDFLVVEPSVDDEAGESVRLRRALRDLRLPTDIIVVSRSYAEDWADVHGSVVHAAFSQGRVLAS
jgi:predicted nucleotidyltransferase